MASFAYRQDKKLSRNKVVINLCIRVLFAEFVVKSRGEVYVCKLPHCSCSCYPISGVTQCFREITD